jgi:sulfonate transport system substrate-binding protein
VVIDKCKRSNADYGKEFKLAQAVQQYMSERMEGLPKPVGVAEIEKMNRVSDWFYKKGIIPKKPVIQNFVVDVTKI